MNDIITRETIQAHLDGLTTMIAAFNANDPRTINVPGYPLMVRAVDYNAMSAQLAEAQRDAARYRTLRSLWFQFGTMANIRTEPGISLHRINMAGDLHTLDAAIDAAKGESNE